MEDHVECIPGGQDFQGSAGGKRIHTRWASDEPWRWQCWATNIIKCAEKDKVWKQIRRMKGERRQRILDASSLFLKEKLEIIHPKMVVVMGNATAELFDEFVQTDVLDVRAPH